MPSSSPERESSVLWQSPLSRIARWNKPSANGDAINRQISTAPADWPINAESGRRAALGAYHGAELNFLADSFPADCGHRPGDVQLGQAMRNYWVQFAKTGYPNGPGVPEWPAYDARSDVYLELGPTIRKQPVARQLRIFDRIANMILSE